ncbi:hypothetical protein BH23CHL5_BH23CHL5_02330 [soil metagenome]
MSSDDKTTISIPFPDYDLPQLKITAAPARLNVFAGDDLAWVAGNYTDPSGETGYRVNQHGPVTQLTHDRHFSGLRKGVPQFDLALGTGRSFSLAIETGASDKTVCDLGGVSLTDLDCKQGAGEFTLDFSRPNPVEMAKLMLAAGAAALELRNLANSNASEISITGGAASFIVDFGGELQRPMHARLNIGMAELRITIPAETAANIRTNSTLGTVNVGDGFMTKEGAYWSEGAIKGDVPELSIEIVTALGSVRIDLI